MQVTFFYRKPYPFHYSIEKVFQGIRKKLPEEVEQKVHESPFHSQGILPRIKNIIAAAKNQGQINHITGDVHYLALGLKGKNTILTIHDLGFMKHPNPLARVFLWLFWIFLPVHKVRYVTTISEATKKNILKYSKCRPEKVIVIPNYLEEGITFQPKAFNDAKPVLLQIGAQFNKNIERLIEAIKDMPVQLRIIGHLSEEQGNLLEDKQINYSTASSLSEGELKKEYQNCDMVTFCSTLEGFGLPILEAQATGRPVVTSNVSSMPEVAANAASFVDPYSIASIRKGILKVIEDEGFRDQLIHDGLENVRRFEPEVVAETYLEVYRKVGK